MNYLGYLLYFISFVELFFHIGGWILLLTVVLGTACLEIHAYKHRKN